MRNPFKEWTLSKVQEHNARMAAPKKLTITTAASLLADASEKLTLKKTQKIKLANKAGSHLEERFLSLWNAASGPELVREFRFHATRKWRADFAHFGSKTLIEIEGGAWGGRHTHGAGYLADSEKYAEAFLLGWNKVGLTQPLLRQDFVERLVKRVSQTSP